MFYMLQSQLKKTPEEQEDELKAKYPGLVKKSAESVLLQKRLNKGHKFFDSGDYNMARAKTAQHRLSTGVASQASVDCEQRLDMVQEDLLLLQESTGVTIATLESVPAARRKSMGSDGVTSAIRSSRVNLTSFDVSEN